MHSNISLNSPLNWWQSKRGGARHPLISLILLGILISIPDLVFPHCEVAPTGTSPPKGSSLIDGVIAVVDDEAITCRELQRRYEEMRKTFPEITINEVLDSMINRLLLLKEARLLRISAGRGLSPLPDEDRIIEDYIDLRIRPSVRVSEEEVQAYFDRHSEEFKGRSYQDVAEEIERLLIEQKTNDLLKEQLEALKRKYYIRIHLPDLVAE